MAGMFLIENPMFQQGLTPQKTGVPTSAHSSPQKTSRLPPTPKKSSRPTMSSGGVSCAALIPSTPTAKRAAHTQAYADVVSPPRRSGSPLSSVKCADSRIEDQGQTQGQHTIGRPPGATLLPAQTHTHTTRLNRETFKAPTIGTSKAQHAILRKNENPDHNPSKKSPAVSDPHYI